MEIASKITSLLMVKNQSSIILSTLDRSRHFAKTFLQKVNKNYPNRRNNLLKIG